MAGRGAVNLVPKVILVLLLLLWTGLGIWMVFRAPFGSGTDESIRYVAFAAAKHRWATEEDFRRYGIDHFYYPPLYFLCFAPFHGGEPEFVERYPAGPQADQDYIYGSSTTMVSEQFLAGVPPNLDRLYRQAKFFSLALGLLVLLCLMSALWLLFPGEYRWWYVLLGSAPLILLPQFLYYHTLCNNDSLVNALGAGTILCFMGAILALEGNRERLFTSLGLGMSLLAGLALLTKMSGMVLLPLLPALAVAWCLSPAGNGGQRHRCAKALRLLALMAVICLAGGGWWILHRALEGDWTGNQAHRLAHPWAFDPRSIGEIGWLFDQVIGIFRSYYGLFTGVLVSLPEWVFVTYLLLPAATIFVAAVLLVRRRRRRWNAGTGGQPSRLRVWMWAVLAFLFLGNFLLIIAGTLQIRLSYGRLMFPTLVASHALFTLVVSAAVRGRPLRIIAGTLLLVVYLGGLFGWTLSRRLTWAVTQPRQNLRTLSYSERNPQSTNFFGPVWDCRVEQPLLVPPGTVVGLRVELSRHSLLPLFRADLHGKIDVRDPDGKWSSIPLRRAAIGDNDFCLRWLDLELSSPVTLHKQSPVILSLEGRPPLLFPSTIKVRYASVSARRFSQHVGSALVNGNRLGVALCVAVVYR